MLNEIGHLWQQCYEKEYKEILMEDKVALVYSYYN